MYKKLEYFIDDIMANCYTIIALIILNFVSCYPQDESLNSDSKTSISNFVKILDSKEIGTNITIISPVNNTTNNQNMVKLKSMENSASLRSVSADSYIKFCPEPNEICTYLSHLKCYPNQEPCPPCWMRPRSLANRRAYWRCIRFDQDGKCPDYPGVVNIVKDCDMNTYPKLPRIHMGKLRIKN